MSDKLTDADIAELLKYSAPNEYDGSAIGVRGLIRKLLAEREAMKTEATRNTELLEKLDEAGQTAITDWPAGSSPQFGDGLDMLLDLPKELAERTKAARYITTCLGAASAESDEDSDEMSHANIASMFDHVCKTWPWADPRNTEQKGGE